jgi:hypothetical protein
MKYFVNICLNDDKNRITGFLVCDVAKKKLYNGGFFIKDHYNKVDNPEQHFILFKTYNNNICFEFNDENLFHQVINIHYGNICHKKLKEVLSDLNFIMEYML